MTAQLQSLDDTKISAALRAHIGAVRLFLRDFSELNLLIQGEESSDRMVAWATLDMLSDFNGTPPFTRYGLTDLMDLGLHSFMVRGTVISLLQSVGLLQTRNHLPFSDGGLSVAINDKAPMIQSWLQLLQSSYEQMKSKIKISLNIMTIMDMASSGVHSDYAMLSAIGLYP